MAPCASGFVRRLCCARLGLLTRRTYTRRVSRGSCGCRSVVDRGGAGRDSDKLHDVAPRLHSSISISPPTHMCFISFTAACVRKHRETPSFRGAALAWRLRPSRRSRFFGTDERGGGEGCLPL